ncbi:MAG: hypothetical protein ACUVQT_10135 [bacterium]
MARRKVGILFVLLSGLMFGYSMTQDILNKRPSVYNADWQNVFLTPSNARMNKCCILTDQNSSNLITDSILMQQSQCNDSKVTFGRITLESAGALAGGILLAYPIAQVSKYEWQVGYPIGFSIGSALGATLVGNTLMEPNGSLLKSTIGSTLGTALGGLIYIGHVISAGFEHDPERKSEEYGRGLSHLGCQCLVPLLVIILGFLKSVKLQ